MRIGVKYAYIFRLNGNNDTMEDWVYDFFIDIQNIDNCKIMMGYSHTELYLVMNKKYDKGLFDLNKNLHN